MPKLRPEAEKGITIGTAYGWAAGIGAVQRLSPKAASIMEFIGAIGGLIGAMLTPPGVADVCEGIASSSGAMIGLALTAPGVSRRVIQGKGETGAKGPDRLMLKAGGAAKDMFARGLAAEAVVGAGLPE
jgi:hypothetical protein